MGAVAITDAIRPRPARGSRRRTTRYGSNNSIPIHQVRVSEPSRSPMYAAAQNKRLEMLLLVELLYSAAKHACPSAVRAGDERPVMTAPQASRLVALPARVQVTNGPVVVEQRELLLTAVGGAALRLAGPGLALDVRVPGGVW